MTHRTSKTSLFLIELMIVLLVFALCATVCVSLFVSSRLKSNESRGLSGAMLQAQSAAELLKSGKELPSAASILGGVYEDGNVQVGYGSEWEPVALSDARYILSIVPSSSASAAGLSRADIAVVEQDNVLFTLEVTYYTGSREVTPDESGT